MAATTTTTVSVQPGAIISLQTKTNQWSSGLCDCCEDMSICCFGFWCPCCLMCTTSQEFGECLCLPLLDMCCGTIIPPATYAMRSTMRERYRLQGTMCDDCCVVTCCTICVWCQMAREVKFRRQPNVFVNQTFTQPYQPLMTQPPVNPAYQPPQQSNPPAYGQQFKPDQAQAQAPGYYPTLN